MCVLWDDCELWLLHLILHESKLTCRHCSDFFPRGSGWDMKRSQECAGRERECVYLQYITVRRFKKIECESWYTVVYSLHSHISRATLLIGCDYTHTHTHLGGERGLSLCKLPLLLHTPHLPTQTKDKHENMPNRSDLALSYLCADPLSFPPSSIIHCGTYCSKAALQRKAPQYLWTCGRHWCQTWHI